MYADKTNDRHDTVHRTAAKCNLSVVWQGLIFFFRSFGHILIVREQIPEQDIIMRLMLAFLAALFLDTAPARAESVELELVLLADASSSIRTDEFDLQISGYAQAFRDPGVVAAIEGLGGNGIAVTFVQWSATFQQFDSVPWVHVRDEASAADFANAISVQARRVVAFGTATGSALEYGADLLDSNGFSGRRRIIDLCSDEHSNQGPHPSQVRDKIVSRGIIINGLAILDDSFDLRAYFRESVIGGPGSFVITVDSYADFAAAIRLKLEHEISGKPVAGAVLQPAALASGRSLPPQVNPPQTQQAR